jgi:hypothetical protein
MQMLPIVLISFCVCADALIVLVILCLCWCVCGYACIVEIVLVSFCVLARIVRYCLSTVVCVRTDAMMGLGSLCV